MRALGDDAVSAAGDLPLESAVDHVTRPRKGFFFYERKAECHIHHIRAIDEDESLRVSREIFVETSDPRYALDLVVCSHHVVGREGALATQHRQHVPTFRD